MHANSTMPPHKNKKYPFLKISFQNYPDEEMEWRDKETLKTLDQNTL